MMITFRSHWSRPIHTIFKNTDRNNTSYLSIRLKRNVCSLCQRSTAHGFLLSRSGSVGNAYYSLLCQRNNLFNKFSHKRGSTGFLNHGGSTTALNSTSSTNRTSVSLNEVRNSVAYNS